jgi:hypothetical protein
MFRASATATESPFPNHSTLPCFATANSFLKDFLVKKGNNRLFRSQQAPIIYVIHGVSVGNSSEEKNEVSNSRGSILDLNLNLVRLLCRF